MNSFLAGKNRISRFHDEKGNFVDLAGWLNAFPAFTTATVKRWYNYRPKVPMISYRARRAIEGSLCEYLDRFENIIALGPSGTGKTHIALGLAACQKGLKVCFITAASLVHELIEAADEKHLLRLQRQLASQNLLIVDELGFVPLSKTGAELLFEVVSQCYERGSLIITSKLPFEEWTQTFGSERLTGALLDRLSHHIHIP
jgi:DNA replication protein DnaC